MMDNDEQSWEEIWDADAQESPHDVADTVLDSVVRCVGGRRARTCPTIVITDSSGATGR